MKAEVVQVITSVVVHPMKSVKVTGTCLDFSKAVMIISSTSMTNRRDLVEAPASEVIATSHAQATIQVPYTLSEWINWSTTNSVAFTAIEVSEDSDERRSLRGDNCQAYDLILQHYEMLAFSLNPYEITPFFSYFDFDFYLTFTSIYFFHKNTSSMCSIYSLI